MSLKLVHAIIVKWPCVPPVYVGHYRKGCHGEVQTWALPDRLGRLCVWGGDTAPSGAGGTHMERGVGVEHGMRTGNWHPKHSVLRNGLNTLGIRTDTLWKYFKSKIWDHCVLGTPSEPRKQLTWAALATPQGFPILSSDCTSLVGKESHFLDNGESESVRSQGQRVQ